MSEILCWDHSIREPGCPKCLAEDRPPMTTIEQGDELARVAARVLESYRRKDGLTRWAIEQNRINAEQRMTEALAENADRILAAIRSQHNGARQGDKVLRDLLGEARRKLERPTRGLRLEAEDAQYTIARIDAALSTSSPSEGMAG